MEKVNYTLLVVILHNLEHLPDLLEAWKKAGIPGITLLPSSGGFEAASQLQRSGLAGLLSVFEHSAPQQRTLLSLIDNPETLAIAISEAERVVGGFDRPRSGILFTMPVGQALGLQKWGESHNAEKNAKEQNREPKQLDKGTANLLGWFEEEVRQLHGSQTLNSWRKKRSLQVSVVFKDQLNPPTIVTVDTPLMEVLKAFLKNPNVPIACVINQEERLVGMIKEEWFAEMMLVPAMPEKFIQDPEQYDKAIRYARMDSNQKAFDIMVEPFFINNECTLEEAYAEMQSKGSVGLPVVNKHYRVVGYLSLTQLLGVYFG
jgi:CBS domain-containing protein